MPGRRMVQFIGRIIRNPIDDLRRIRQSEYQLRAGDIPEFLEKLDEAKNQERKNLFENSMKMFNEALRYAPDDPDLKRHRDMASARLNAEKQNQTDQYHTGQVKGVY